LVVRQRIRFPCTTMSMPFDFNPNASNEQAKGILFTFQWKWAFPGASLHALCVVSKVEAVRLLDPLSFIHNDLFRSPTFRAPFSTIEFLHPSASHKETLDAPA
jgi:hypothetical protein